ncbi:MAG: hypothetical protein ACPG1A_12265, partial [Halioglobus sp.]
LSGDDTYLVMSFVIKWLALLFVAAAYLVFLLLGSRSTSSSKDKPAAKGTAPAVSGQIPADDGFDFLRQKKRLENKAEKVIAAKPGKRDN